MRPGRLRRSHRRNLVEALRSWFGIYPFRCPECQKRYFRREWKERGGARQLEQPTREKRPSRRRLVREVLLYVAALAGLLTLIYVMMR
jgi:hypothetical protein